MIQVVTDFDNPAVEWLLQATEQKFPGMTVPEMRDLFRRAADVLPFFGGIQPPVIALVWSRPSDGPPVLVAAHQTVVTSSPPTPEPEAGQ